MQSTLILSKSDGSIIRSTGLLATSKSSGSEDTLGNASNGTNGFGLEDTVKGSEEAGNYDRRTEIKSKAQSAEEVARMVFQFVASAKIFTEGMDSSDEVKLLRLRTRKNEIVIVPGKLLRSCQDYDY